MAMHLFRYRLKCLLRDRDLLFWSILFPLLLSTLFYFAFGNLLGYTGSFEPVRVAIVDSPAYRHNVYLRQMVAAIATPGPDQLLSVTLTSEADALRKLDEGEVTGVITVVADDAVSADDAASAADAASAFDTASAVNAADTAGAVDSVAGGGARRSSAVGLSASSAASSVQLIVTKSGISQSILKAVVDDYVHTAATAASIISQNPSALAELIGRLGDRKSYTQQVSYSYAVADPSLSYFYTLVAMTCLYAGFWGLRNTIDVQADLSPQGARRSVAPTHKLAVVLCDWSAALLISCVELAILLVYLVAVLKIDFGDQLGYVLLTCLAGSFAGVSLGTFIGTLFGRSEGPKVALLIGASMTMSFLAGLMIVEMKYIVARHAPFVSYVNPAALITDAFYSLYVFDNHNRFFLNIGLLCAISAVTCLISYLRLRRERYASL